MTRGVLIVTATLAGLLLAPVANGGGSSGLTEVVVTLDAPPLAEAIRTSRVLTSRAKAARLDLRNPTSAGYLASLAAAQRTVATRITTTIPGARVTWRYQVVLDGLAIVSASRDQLAGTLNGAVKVFNSDSYRGAPSAWCPSGGHQFVLTR